MACANCGADAPEWAVQCPSCGAELLPAGATPPQPPAGSWPPPSGPSQPGWGGPSGGPGGGFPPPQQPPWSGAGGFAYPGAAAAGAPMGSRVGQYAGWWYRVGSTLIDGIILAIINSLLELGLKGIGVLLAFLVDFAYNGYFLSTRGQTIGDMALGIRVADADRGTLISFWRGVGRYAMMELLFILLVIPGIIDILFPLWDSRKQTIHDKTVNTVVVHTR